MDERGDADRQIVAESHQPDRPSWDCGTCRKPWPCQSFKQQVLAEGPDASQAVFAAGYLVAAAQDLTHLTPAQVYGRIVAWARPAPLHGPETRRVRDAREVVHTSVADGICGLLTTTLPLDPGLSWVVLDRNDIYDVAAALAAVHAAYLTEHGYAYVTVTGYTVTSVLAGEHPLDPPPPGAVAAYEEELVRAAGPYAGRYALWSRRHNRHRLAEPHFHISHLAVDPGWQSRGLAGEQLDALHARLDPLGVTASLVLAGRTMYLPLTKRGYEPCGHTTASDEGPEVIGLRRLAREFCPAPTA